MSPLRRDLHATCIIGSRLSLQDTFDFAELTAHLIHHALCGTSHGVHRQPAEQEGHHGPDKRTDQYVRIHQRYLEVIHHIQNIGLFDRFDGSIGQFHSRLSDMLHTDLNLLDIRSQQSQCRQRCRPDGKTFTGRRRRITQSIECIGTFTYFRIETAHLGISSGVVGDRPVSIGSQRNTQRRQHTDRCYTDSIESLADVAGRDHILHIESCRTQIRENDRYGNRHHRNRGRDHSHTDTRNDHRCRTRLGALRDFPSRFIRVRSVIFGRLSDDDTGNQSDDNRERKAQPVIDLKRM